MPALDISRNRALWWLVGISGVATLLSVVFMHQSLRLDEAQSLWQISRSPFEILIAIGQDVHVPLYHQLLHFWQMLTGNTIDGARILSRIFFIASIPALYLLGSYIYTRRTALFACALFALSPFMNWYGSEIRMYTLLCFFAILNQYFFLRLLKEGKGMWGYILTAILGVFSHYFFFLILFAQAVFFLIRYARLIPESFKRLTISWAVIATAFAPWVAFVISLKQIVHQTPTLPIPTAVNLFSAFSEFFFGFQSDTVNTFVLSLWPVLIVFAFLGLRHTKRMRLESEYLLLSVLVPILLAFLISLSVMPLFVSRYLIFTVPPLFLLVADVISHYPRFLGNTVRTALLATMVLTLGIEATSAATPVKEDYRSAAAFVSANAGPQDIFVVTAPFTVYPIEYYYRGTATLTTLPTWNQYETGPIPPFNSDTLPEEVEQIAGDHQNLWLLLSYDQGYNEDVRQYFDTHYRRVRTEEFSPKLNLYVYQLRYGTPVAEAEFGTSKTGSVLR